MFKCNTKALLVHAIHVDQSYKIDCVGRIGGSFAWNDCGMELTFYPDHSMGNIEVTMSAFLPIRKEIYPGVYVVSAIYQFDCNIKSFDIPFSLHLQHCVNLHSSEDIQKMYFISQQSDSDSYHINIQNGIFKNESYYGTLYLNSFCTLYIVWSQKENFQAAPINIVKMNIDHSETASDIIKNVTSCYMDNEQEISKPLPWSYEWMLALPKDHHSLENWNGIFSVYVKLAALRKVSIRHTVHSLHLM